MECFFGTGRPNERGSNGKWPVVRAVRTHSTFIDKVLGVPPNNYNSNINDQCQWITITSIIIMLKVGSVVRITKM